MNGQAAIAAPIVPIVAVATARKWRRDRSALFVVETSTALPSPPLHLSEESFVRLMKIYPYQILRLALRIAGRLKRFQTVPHTRGWSRHRGIGQRVFFLPGFVFL